MKFPRRTGHPETPQRTVAQIAKEFGLNRETLRQWVKAEREARKAGSGRSRPADGGQLSTDEREELKRRRIQVAELQLEKEILRKAPAGYKHISNQHRPHTALGGRPPATRVTNLSGQDT